MENLAVKWAARCVFEHPKPHETEFSKSGQNLAISGGTKPNFTANALMGWLNEVRDYNYASHHCQPGKACGHYTQVNR